MSDHGIRSHRGTAQVVYTTAMLHRRDFLARTVAIAAASAAPAAPQGKVPRRPGNRIRLALNAYSFDKPLRDGSMTLADVVDYCAQHRIDSLDATGYYFPGYPQVPTPEYIHNLKRRAFLNGVAIHGTGVRNDFAVPDPARRKDDVRLVKEWIGVARELGASVIRVFSGQKVPGGYTFDQALAWMAPDLRECVAYGREHGVMVGLQNHNDFLKTADETIRLIQAVDSDWFGSILDVGSFRQRDPYRETETLLPYAISWQLKENVWDGKKEVPTDLAKVKAIVERIGYSGVLPIETLGAGDPRVKVARFVEQVRQVFLL